MSRPLVVLSILASLWLAAPAGADDEVSAVEVCREYSFIARDVMTKRQNKAPMSATLPFAIAQIEKWVEKYGFEMNSEKVEEGAAILVLPAYEFREYPNDRIYDEDRQRVISDFENRHFGTCYESMTSD